MCTLFVHIFFVHIYVDECYIHISVYKSVDILYTIVARVYSTVQNAVYNVDYVHLKSLDLAKLFRLCGLGLGIQVFGLNCY